MSTWIVTIILLIVSWYVIWDMVVVNKYGEKCSSCGKRYKYLNGYGGMKKCDGCIRYDRLAEKRHIEEVLNYK
jgi:hypothetical protein